MFISETRATPDGLLATIIGYILFPLVGMLWGSIIIIPIVLILSVYDYIYCAIKNKYTVIKEIVVLSGLGIYAMYANDKNFSLSFILLFIIMVSLTQYSKYLLVKRHCKDFVYNKNFASFLIILTLSIIAYFIYLVS